MLRLLGVLIPLLLGLGAAKAQAEYPARVVKIVVGFPAGSSADILTRVYAQKLSERFGQQFIIENRPGAAGNTGAENVARAEPDGYTLFVATVSNTIGASLLKNLQFSFANDLAGVALVASAPNALVINPALGAKDVQEFVNLAKQRPGELFYASPGNGSAPHLAAELFNMTTGIRLVHVAYRSNPPALLDLLAGRVSAVFSTAPTAVPYVKDGRLRALAVSTAKRSAFMPDIPTMMESGLKDFDTAIWYGFVVPSSTPEPIKASLAAALTDINAMPDVLAHLHTNGAEPLSLKLDAYDRFIAAEVKKWREVVDFAKLSAE